ncbi:MAG: thiamine pyrophosphate-dependent enzyme [Myxococcales bacterium]|nr:thiamine pyrophosphate-dependent enzyme [Myxococcales bacterium]
MQLPVLHMTQEILLGDEAVARGAIDAGLSAAYAYPGTPSTEIFETIHSLTKQHHLPIRGFWSTNEKVALEEAIGVSYCGKRVMVSMKHVGLNVAADPFMNVAVAGAWGGLVLAVADDPSMHSSQNEQDSRYFADFAQVLCVEPADQQEAYELTREAFEVSERLRIPVVLRLVTRLAHSRAVVTLGERRTQNELRYVEDDGLYTLIPSNARRAYAGLIDKQPALQRFSEEHRLNALTIRGEGKPGIIVSGIAWTYLREALGPKLDDFNVLRVSVYPLPIGKVRELIDHSSELMIVEEGYPFIERFVSALGLFREKPVKGKLTGHVPRIGELNPDLLRKTFGLPVKTSLAIAGLEDVLMARPPRLCDACPHGDSYNIINEVRRELDSSMRVMGDIGCYALGYSKPYQAINSCLCMGSSIGMAIGAAHAGISPSLCVIGDGTFTHTGMNALLDAVIENTNIKVFILDNSIVAMTGGQPTTMSDAHLEELVAGLGVKKAHVRTITPVPQKHAENLAIVREELAYQGLSVIIARRACVRYVKEIKEHKRERDAAHAHEGDCANCSGNC